MYDEAENRGSSIADARWADPDYIADKYYFQPGDIWIGRNPHNYDQAIGYRDDRHIMVCAGSGSGKGRSFIVNNLALWPGSTVTFDPKGELPQILANRRSKGDDYCEGMGQDVFVLDPLKKSGVGPEHLAYYDPLSGLDPDDGELPTWAKRIAQSLIEVHEGTESAVWAKRAGRLISLIIMHVVTGDFDDHERSLMMVLRFILEGSQELIDAAIKRNPEIDASDFPDPTVMLLEEMAENPACRGWIASEARNLLRQAEKTPKFFESVRGEAADQLDWLKSAGIEESLTGAVDGVRRLDASRRFDPARLKTDPAGASVFIVMPVDDIKTYGPWVQSVFLGIFAAMRRISGPPASGSPVLTVLDEFSSLGYQDYIANALDNIRGASMKLAIIVQNFGKLKKLYADEMESFFTNSSLELYFGKIGQIASDYVQKELGQTEVVRLARSQNQSESESDSRSQAVAFGQTASRGGSETMTDSSSTALSEGENWSWSDGVNWSKSKNWGSSQGNTMGRNYGPHTFFQGFEHSTNYGSNLNRSRGRSHTKGGSKTRGGSRSKNRTETASQAHAVGSTWQDSESRTETQTIGTTTGYQIGGGVAETFHKKPLLDAHEMNAYLRNFPESDRDHPAYPGMMLVRIQGEHPFFVRRSHYDQDPFFEHCFSKDPVHRFVPLNEQPLLGHQYTPAHIITFKMPKKLVDAGYQIQPCLRPTQRFEANQEMFRYSGKGGFDELGRTPCSGRALAIVKEAERRKDGFIMTIRADVELSKSDLLEFKKNTFTPAIGYLNQLAADDRRAKDAAARQAKLEADEAAAKAKREAEAAAAKAKQGQRVDYRRRLSAINERKRALENPDLVHLAVCAVIGALGGGGIFAMMFIGGGATPGEAWSMGIPMGGIAGFLAYSGYLQFARKAAAREEQDLLKQTPR